MIWGRRCRKAGSVFCLVTLAFGTFLLMRSPDSHSEVNFHESNQRFKRQPTNRTEANMAIVKQVSANGKSLGTKPPAVLKECNVNYDQLGN